MLLTPDEVSLRLNSPDNLINKLKSFSGTARDIGASNHSYPQPFSGGSTGLISVPPSVDDIVDSIDDKIRLHGLKGKAVDVLDSALTALSQRVGETDKPAQLAEIAEKMSRIITKENEKNGSKTPQQLIVWQPIMIQENHYEHIEIAE